MAQWQKSGVDPEMMALHNASARAKAAVFLIAGLFSCGSKDERTAAYSSSNDGGDKTTANGGTRGSSRSDFGRGGRSDHLGGDSATMFTFTTDSGRPSGNSGPSGGASDSNASNPCGEGALMCTSATGARCLDVMSDSLNCGRCGRVCPPSATCDGGACRLPRCNPTFALGGAAPMSQVGSEVASIAIGDFNQDGRLDVAATNVDTDAVSIALGNGNGTFDLTVSYPTGSNPKMVAAADLDGDGRLDLAIVNSRSDTLSVLIGTGNGTFEPRVDYPTGGASQSLAIADLNGDGIVDLATADADTGTVSVLLGSGSGSFADGVVYSAGFHPQAVAVGDFDGDQHVDLVTVNEYAPTLSVLRGAGDGTFLASSDSLGQNLHRPLTLAVGDLNNDGNLDIAVVDRMSSKPSGRVVVLFGNGSGAFPVEKDLSSLGEISAIATGDVNGDGRLDLIAKGAGTIRVLLGAGSGVVTLEASFYTPAESGCLVVGDFNGDRRLDALTVASGSSAVLFGAGNGLFGTATTYPTGGSPTSVVVGDLNGDARQDLAVTNNSNGTVSVLLGGGDGTVVSNVEYETRDSPIALGVSDLNDDGMPDLVTSSELKGIVSTLLNQGDGSFSVRMDYETNRTIASHGGQIQVVGVLDSNGDVGIARVTEGGVINVLTRQPDGAFTSSTDYPDSGARAVLLGDLDGDRLQDLIVLSQGMSSVWARLGVGNGAFGPMPEYATSHVPSQIRAGALNRDGRLELVATTDSTSTTSLMVLLGTGGGALAPSADYAAGQGSTRGIELGDLNGDGNLDIVLAQDATTAVLLGTGDGTVGCSQSYPVVAHSLALGDLNGDGFLDLVSLDYYADAIAVLYNSPL